MSFVLFGIINCVFVPSPFSSNTPTLMKHCIIVFHVNSPLQNKTNQSNKYLSKITSPIKMPCIENPPPLPTTMPPTAAAGQQQQQQHQAQVQQRINAFNAAAASGQLPDQQGNYNMRVQHHKVMAAPRSSLGSNSGGVRSDVVTKFIEMETAAGLQQQHGGNPPPTLTSTKRTVHTTISTSSNSSMGSGSSPNSSNVILITGSSGSNSNNNGKHQTRLSNNNNNNTSNVKPSNSSSSSSSSSSYQKHQHHVHHQKQTTNTSAKTSSSSIITTTATSSSTATTSHQHSRTVWHFTTNPNTNSTENNSINNPSYMSVINNNNDGIGFRHFHICIFIDVYVYT